jgi:hypothetical protein
MEPGDAVVLGSDGLFDNLSDADIAEAVTVMDAQRVSEVSGSGSRGRGGIGSARALAGSLPAGATG